jgi:ABC-2 type transport system permease protein
VASASAIARRAFADARVRTISFAALFFAAALTQATAYREGYPTLAERLKFARTVGENDAARLLYGAPHDLLTVGGYVSWRVGGTMAVFAAAFGLLGAVRAMRAEEDAGRADLLLAGVVSRRSAFLAQLAAIGAGAAVLWLALFVAFLAGGLPAGGSAYLALAAVSVVPVFAGVGALTSQLAPTKRVATGLAAAVLVIAFALRTVAAIASAGLEWLRWATPFGWVEELRPSPTRSRSSCCCPPPPPLSCSWRPQRSRSAATSAAACFRAATARRRGCACFDRRLRRRFAPSAAPSSPGWSEWARSRS